MRREDPAGIQEGIWFQYRIAHTRDRGGKVAGMDGESIRLVESSQGERTCGGCLPPPPGPHPTPESSRGGGCFIRSLYPIRRSQTEQDWTNISINWFTLCFLNILSSRDEEFKPLTCVANGWIGLTQERRENPFCQFVRIWGIADSLLMLTCVQVWLRFPFWIRKKIGLAHRNVRTAGIWNNLLTVKLYFPCCIPPRDFGTCYFLISTISAGRF